MAGLQREADVMRNFLQELWKSEKGATSVEYAVILALIITVAFASIQLLGGSVNDAFVSFNTKFNP
jgi:Flp pilus assembly pilin Flp